MPAIAMRAWKSLRLVKISCRRWVMLSELLRRVQRCLHFLKSLADDVNNNDNNNNNNTTRSDGRSETLLL